MQRYASLKGGARNEPSWVQMACSACPECELRMDRYRYQCTQSGLRCNQAARPAANMARQIACWELPDSSAPRFAGSLTARRNPFSMNELLLFVHDLRLAQQAAAAGRARGLLLASPSRSGVFSKATDRRVEQFTESVSFDHRLYAHDIAGSIAHAQMLAEGRPDYRAGVPPDRARRWTQIRAEIEAGSFRSARSWKTSTCTSSRR